MGEYVICLFKILKAINKSYLKPVMFVTKDPSLRIQLILYEKSCKMQCSDVPESLLKIKLDGNSLTKDGTLSIPTTDFFWSRIVTKTISEKFVDKSIKKCYYIKKLVKIIVG